MSNLFRKIHHRIIYILKYRKKLKKEYGDNMPWGVFIEVRSKRRIKRDKEQSDAFFERASKTITPNKKTVAELEVYLEEKYDAERYEISERDYNMFLINFLNSKYSYLFMDHTSINSNINNFKNTPRINNIRPGEIDPDIRDKISDIEIKPIFYRFKSKSLLDDKYIKVAIEEVTEYLSVSGGIKEGYDIITYLGVTKKDIESKSTAFLNYVALQKEIGKIEY